MKEGMALFLFLVRQLPSFVSHVFVCIFCSDAIFDYLNKTKKIEQ